MLPIIDGQKYNNLVSAINELAGTSGVYKIEQLTDMVRKSKNKIITYPSLEGPTKIVFTTNKTSLNKKDDVFFIKKESNIQTSFMLNDTIYALKPGITYFKPLENSKNTIILSCASDAEITLYEKSIKTIDEIEIGFNCLSKNQNVCKLLPIVDNGKTCKKIVFNEYSPNYDSEKTINLLEIDLKNVFSIKEMHIFKPGQTKSFSKFLTFGKNIKEIANLEIFFEKNLTESHKIVIPHNVRFLKNFSIFFGGETTHSSAIVDNGIYGWQFGDSENPSTLETFGDNFIGEGTDIENEFTSTPSITIYKNTPPIFVGTILPKYPEIKIVYVPEGKTEIYKNCDFVKCFPNAVIREIEE